MSRLQTFWDDLRSNFWFVPALMALAAIGLAFGLVGLDRTLQDDVVRKLGWIYTGGPEGARGVLTAIASSIIGVAGTTFSITIAVLSLTSGQYGPRLLRGFMRDRGNQVVLGAFTSTFLYCILVLRTVRGTDETTYVPHLSVTFGVALAMLDVGLLIYFVNHVASSIQASQVIENAGDELDGAIDRLFPEEVGKEEGEPNPPQGRPADVRAEESGYVVAIDDAALLRTATENDLVVKVVARPGDHVVFGVPLLSVWPEPGSCEKRLRKTYTIARSRTTLQDAEFAFLQLAEIAVRALSPGINDPFTAMACVDRLTVALCRLAERERPSAFRHDEAGRLRVVADPYPYVRLVDAALRHIRHAAKDQPAVTERLRVSIDLVLSRARDEALAAALKSQLPPPLG